MPKHLLRTAWLKMPFENVSLSFFGRPYLRQQFIQPYLSKLINQPQFRQLKNLFIDTTTTVSNTAAVATELTKQSKRVPGICFVLRSCCMQLQLFYASFFRSSAQKCQPAIVSCQVISDCQNQNKPASEISRVYETIGISDNKKGFLQQRIFLLRQTCEISKT